MKTKLIKVQDEYWLSTDKQTDFCYHLGHKEILKVTGVGEKSGEVHHEKGWNKPNEVVFIDRELSAKLSLKNCQAIERGYDLDELAGDEFENSGWTQGFREEMKEDFIEIYTGAFSKALEILITKKFTEEDMRKALHRMATSFMKGYNFDNDVDFQEADKIIQSIQQTEWDVEIEMEMYDDPDFVLDLNKEMRVTPKILHRPKLDADGCIILKRVV